MGSQGDLGEEGNIISQGIPFEILSARGFLLSLLQKFHHHPLLWIDCPWSADCYTRRSAKTSERTGRGNKKKWFLNEGNEDLEIIQCSKLKDLKKTMKVLRFKIHRFLDTL